MYDRATLEAAFARALDAEARDFVARFGVTRNGYIPSRVIDTPYGPVTVRMPRVRGGSIPQHSHILPSYSRALDALPDEVARELDPSAAVRPIRCFWCDKATRAESQRARYHSLAKFKRASVEPAREVSADCANAVADTLSGMLADPRGLRHYVGARGVCARADQSAMRARIARLCDSAALAEWITSDNARAHGVSTGDTPAEVSYRSTIRRVVYTAHTLAKESGFLV